MKFERINVIVKDPGERYGHTKWIDNTLEALQELVGGRIEVVQVTADMAIVCNEEGRLLDMKPCLKLGGIEFVGTIVVVGTYGDEFVHAPVTFENWKKQWVG